MMALAWGLCLVAVLSSIPVCSATRVESARDALRVDSGAPVSWGAVIANVAVAGYASAVAYDPVNGYVYVADEGRQQHPGNVSVVSGTSVVSTLEVGKFPDGVAFNPLNHEVYVANAVCLCSSGGLGNVTLISGESVVANVRVGAQAGGLAFDSHNGDMYVANLWSNNISLLSGSSVVGSISYPGATYPAGLAYDWTNTNIYAADEGTPVWPGNVSVVSGSRSIASIRAGTGPTAIAVDNTSGDLYVTNFASNNVSVVSAATNTVSATIPVGTFPDGAAYDTANGAVYVTNQGSANVSVIVGTTVEANIDVGANPSGVAYDTGNGDLYVACSTGVYVISLNASAQGVGGSPWWSLTSLQFYGLILPVVSVMVVALVLIARKKRRGMASVLRGTEQRS